MDAQQRAERTPREVFDDHLRLSLDMRVEEDARRNYAENVVFLTGRGTYHGLDGLRELARLLEEELPNARFEYTTRQVEGEVAFLEWTAQAEGARVRDGADSFVIRDGRIVAQTIHYTVEPA